MHDPKFEKEVQQKMAELEFSPSESVWANVEKAMSGRRRRGLFFFWRFALPVLLLMAGSGYYYFTRTEKHPATAKVQPDIPQAQQVSPAPAANPETHAAPAPIVSETPTATPVTHAATPDATATAIASPKTPDNTTYPATKGSSNKNPTLSSTLTAAGTGTPRTHSRNPLAASANRRQQATNATDNIPAASDPQSAAGTPTPGVPTPGTPTPGNNITMTSTDVVRQRHAYPSLADQRFAAAIHAGKLKSQNSAAAIKILQTPRRPWEAAFVGGAGISSLHQMQLSNYSLTQYDPATAAYNATQITSYAATPTKQYIATVGSGVSFWAGIQAQKALSARWGFSLGLNLHYYSNSVHIGQQVSSYIPAAASLLTSSTVAPIQSYPYYSAGDVQAYTNRYYFLELPVAIEYKINNSKLLPLFWDGGFSIGYLMGSSAVYYNTHSGVYFKDGGVANHTQVNLSTALMVGLPVRGLRVQLGPQIQYGLTPLLNKEQSGEQHIFYGGIRLVVFPGKK